ncbi:peptidoglycan-binding protein [Flavobacterium sp.]|uniref:peptidoglycan-binding protein n=1 Tax=Flavobacterium sp. TaxID=239 RepID=UPI00391DAD81
MARIDVLQKAESQLGTTESPPNSNKCIYGSWYHPSLNGQKWCAMFVSWVFHHAGHPLGNIQTSKGIHHCQSAHNYYKQKGLLTSNPQQGDIVIYDWEGNGHANHIGIFIRWTNTEKTFIEAYEGNTSVGNDSDGGKVMKRIRSKNLIKSFINPGVYIETAVTTPESELTKGARGSAVTQVQKNLYELGYVIEIDGWFGNETEMRLKDYQTKNAMTVSGKADTVTIGALQEDAREIAIAKSKFVSGSYLRRGNTGFMVTEVQRVLNAKDSLLKLPITGNFDMPTLQAVKAFQTKNGLDSDGIVGPKTFGKLGIG